MAKFRHENVHHEADNPHISAHFY